MLLKYKKIYHSFLLLLLLTPSPADEITASFRRFGPLVVDWPHKAESKSYFPPKGYAFLLFQVRQLARISHTYSSWLHWGIKH